MDILNKLPRMDTTGAGTGCCPIFHPEEWDDKLFVLNQMLFVKASSKSFFYIPINLGSVMTKTMKTIQDAEADDKEHYLILSHDISKWECNHFFLVSKEIPGMKMEKLEGTYLSKVYEGNYSELPKWISHMKNNMKDQNHTAGNIYAFYTTCPKCAKTYGKNYVVLFAQIQSK